MKGSLTHLLLLKKFPDTRLHSRGKLRVLPQFKLSPVFPSSARDECSFPCFVGKGFPEFPSHFKRRRSQQECREELLAWCNHYEDLKMSQSTPDEPDLAALPRLSPRVSTQTTVARVTALWHLEGKPQIRFNRQEERSCFYSMGGKWTCMSPLERRPESPVETLVKPQNHVSTGH